MRSRICPVRSPIITISRSGTTVRPIVAPKSTISATVDSATGGDTATVSASAVPSDSKCHPGSVAPTANAATWWSWPPTTSVAPAIGENDAVPGAFDAETSVAGEQRFVDTEQLERVRPPRAGVQVVHPGAAGEADLGELVTAQCVDHPLGDVEPAPAAQLVGRELGELEHGGDRIERHAGAHRQVGQRFLDAIDGAALVVPGDDRADRFALRVEEHSRLADAGDPDAQHRTAALADGTAEHVADGVSEDAGVHLYLGAVDHPRRRGRGGRQLADRRGRRPRPSPAWSRRRSQPARHRS